MPELLALANFHFFKSAYSIESTRLRGCFDDVFAHADGAPFALPLEEVMSTRVLAAVPVLAVDDAHFVNSVSFDGLERREKISPARPAMRVERVHRANRPRTVCATSLPTRTRNGRFAD